MLLGYVFFVTHFVGGAAMASHVPECPVGSSETRVVHVRFFNQSRLPLHEFRTITDVANRIWEPYGIRVDTQSRGEAINVIVSGSAPEVNGNDGAPAVIGTTMFSNGHATPNIHLSLGAAERLEEWFDADAREFGGRRPAVRNEPVLRVLGVALAHELAHYLLDTSEHSPEGLLRPHPTFHEMEDARPERFSLTCPQRRALMDRKHGLPIM